MGMSLGLIKGYGGTLAFKDTRHAQYMCIWRQEEHFTSLGYVYCQYATFLFLVQSGNASMPLPLKQTLYAQNERGSSFWVYPRS